MKWDIGTGAINYGRLHESIVFGNDACIADFQVIRISVYTNFYMYSS